MRFLKWFVLIIMLCFIFGTNVCWAEEKKTDPRTDPKTAWVYKWKFSGKTAYGDKPAERKNDPGVVSYDASGGGETATVRAPMSLRIEYYDAATDKDQTRWEEIKRQHEGDDSDIQFNAVKAGTEGGGNILSPEQVEEILSGLSIPEEMKNYIRRGVVMDTGGMFGTYAFYLPDADGTVLWDGPGVGTPLHGWGGDLAAAVAANYPLFDRILLDYKGDNNGCWFCDLYYTLFITGNEMASRLYDGLKIMCIYLLGLWFSFYILFKMVKYYLSLGAIDPRKFFPEIFKPFMSMIIAIILILNIKQVYTNFIDPVAEIAIGFSSIISDAGTGSGSNYANVRSSIFTGTQSFGCIPVKTPEAKAGLGGNVNNSIQCFLQKMSSAVLSQMAIGATFMHGAWNPGRKWGGIVKVPNFGILFVGLLVYVTSIIAFLACSLKLIDGMLRLIFVTSLLPLWIACWVLPASKKYAAKAFEMFFHVLVNFLFLAVIVIMVLYLFDASLIDINDKSELITLLREDKIEEAANLIRGDFFLFRFVMCMVIAFTLLGKVDSFVSHFVSGGKLGVGEELSKIAVGMAIQKPAQKIIKPIVNKVVDKTGKKIASKVKGFFKKEEPPTPPAKKEPYASITENAGKENEVTHVFNSEEEYKKYQEQERQRFERERREQDERLRKEKEQRERERREEEERRRKKDEEEEKKRQEEEKRVSDALNKLDERLAEIEKERSVRESQARMKDMERQHDEIWKGWKGPVGPTTPDGSPASTQQPEDKDTPTANPAETTPPKPEAEDKTSSDSGAPDDGAGKK